MARERRTVAVAPTDRGARPGGTRLVSVAFAVKRQEGLARNRLTMTETSGVTDGRKTC